MKSLFVALLLIVATTATFGRTGYRITLNIKGASDTMVYLAHYYGQPGPKIYVADSARLNKKGTVVLESSNADFKGGIYMILFKDGGMTNFELLLNPGDDMTINAKKSEIPQSVQFSNSPENARFMSYLELTRSYAEQQKDLEGQLQKATTHLDSNQIREQAVAAAKERTSYMVNYSKNYPGTLLAKIFRAMQTVEVPAGPHYLSDGKTNDSTYSYTYYKSHFWDGTDLQDDRLIYTPLYDGKLNEYFNKLVLPWPDSMTKEADELLTRTKGTKDMFHYTLHWLTHYAENSKVMGMDEVFVHLVEHYYMKGDAFWLTPEMLNKYVERAKAIAPNVLGNIAPAIKLPNVFTQKEEILHDVNAKYTLLIFYSPTCGHCQHELPLIDSVYEAVLKNKGGKVFTVATEGDQQAIATFLKKLGVDQKWINTYDPKHIGDFRSKYDVYSTPTIYLLNDKKIIKGKRLDHTNIGTLVEQMEKQQLTKS